MNKKTVSIVAPVFNEEDCIEEFISRISSITHELSSNYSFELLLVDDGSSDKSREIILGLTDKYPIIKLIELRRNFGQTPALQAGIDNSSGEIIITMDSDLQHFPEEIPKFLSKLDEGYDMVCGWRHKRAEGILRRWPSSAANYLIRKVTSLPFHDFGTTFRAYKADLGRELKLFGEFHRFVPALGYELGGQVTEIPIENIERPTGKSSYGLGRTLGVFLDLFVLAYFIRFMKQPMRAFGKLGLFFFILGFFIILILTAFAYTYNYPSFKEHPGWFILSVMLILSAVQVIIAGILAEILVRIHFRTSDRKIYRIKKIWPDSNENS